MRKCERCGQWFSNQPGTPSRLCDRCWVDLGQLTLQFDPMDDPDRQYDWQGIDE